MAIAKVIEVISEGDTLEGAMEAAVRDASKTVRNIKHVYVEGIQALVENDEIVSYRLNAKLTFVVEED
jgi:flavin-binding protein dodecin